MRDGGHIDYYLSGEINFKCFYLDGKLPDEFISYYISGEIKCKYNYLDGKLHGETIGYYSSGDISSKCNYSRSGSIFRYYLGGELHGECISYSRSESIFKILSLDTALQMEWNLNVIT